MNPVDPDSRFKVLPDVKLVFVPESLAIENIEPSPTVKLVPGVFIVPPPELYRSTPFVPTSYVPPVVPSVIVPLSL